jgi:hypothetical protein
VAVQQVVVQDVDLRLPALEALDLGRYLMF